MDVMKEKANPVTSPPCFPLGGMLRSSKGCTTLQVEKTLYANLTAKRQPSRRLVFTDDFVTCDSYRDPSLPLRMTVSGGKVRT